MSTKHTADSTHVEKTKSFARICVIAQYHANENVASSFRKPSTNVT